MTRKHARSNSQHRGLRNLVLLILAVLLLGGAGLTTFGPGTLGRDREAVRDTLLRAKLAYAEGNLEQAELFLKTRPESEAASRILLGKVLLARGRLKKAEAIFQELLKGGEAEFDALMGLGEVFERGRNYRLAIRHYKRAAEKDPKNPLVWRRLGLAQHQGGDSMGALFSIRRSLSVLPGQEDLSQLMNEIGMSRGGRNMAGMPSQPGFQDPFDSFGSRRPNQFGPSVPQPQIPDPLRDLPIPGRQRR